MNKKKPSLLNFLGKKESQRYLTGMRVFKILVTTLGVILVGMIVLPMLFPSFFSTSKVLMSGGEYGYITKEHIALSVTVFLEISALLLFFLHYQMWKLGEK